MHYQFAPSWQGFISHFHSTLTLLAKLRNKLIGYPRALEVKETIRCTSPAFTIAEVIGDALGTLIIKQNILSISRSVSWAIETMGDPLPSTSFRFVHHWILSAVLKSWRHCRRLLVQQGQFRSFPRSGAFASESLNSHRFFYDLRYCSRRPPNRMNHSRVILMFSSGWT